MMEINVLKWIHLARKISNNLLDYSGNQIDEDVVSWMKESERGKRILEELKNPDFYVKKDAERRKFEEKYN